MLYSRPRNVGHGAVSVDCAQTILLKPSVLARARGTHDSGSTYIMSYIHTCVQLYNTSRGASPEKLYVAVYPAQQWYSSTLPPRQKQRGLTDLHHGGRHSDNAACSSNNAWVSGTGGDGVHVRAIKIFAFSTPRKPVTE